MGIKSTDLLPKINAEGVGTTPKSNLRTDTDMFGGRQGKDLADAGKGMMDVSAQLDAYAKKKADAADLTNTLEIDEGLQQLQSDLERQSADRTKGKAKGWADDAAKYTDKAIQKLRGKREFNSPDEAAKADHKLKTMAMRLKAKADVKEIEQTRQYNGEMITKKLEGSVAAGSSDWADEESMLLREKEISGLVRKSYDNDNMVAEKGTEEEPSAFDIDVKQKVSDYYSNAITGALNTMDLGGVEQAAEIFKHVREKGKVKGQQLSDLSAKIRTASIRVIGKDIADKVWDQAKDPETGKVSIQKARELVEESLLTSHQKIAALDSLTRKQANLTADKEQAAKERNLDSDVEKDELEVQARKNTREATSEALKYLDMPDTAVTRNRIIQDNQHDPDRKDKILKVYDDVIGKGDDPAKRKAALKARSIKEETDELDRQSRANDKALPGEVGRLIKNHGENTTAALDAIWGSSKYDADMKGKLSAAYKERNKDSKITDDDIESARVRAETQRKAFAKEHGQETADKAMTGTESATQAIGNLDKDALTPDLYAEASRLIDLKFAREERDRQRVDYANRKSGQQKLLNDEPLTAEENLAIDSVLGLRGRIEKQLEIEARGLPYTSDESVRRELMKMYRDDKEKFAGLGEDGLDLYGKDYGAKLSIKDLTMFEGMQLALDKDKIREDKATKKQAASAERLTKGLNIAKPFLREAGFTVGGKDDDTGEFMIALAEALEGLEDDPKLSPNERDMRIQNTILGMLMKGDVRTGNWRDGQDIEHAFTSPKNLDMSDWEDENAKALDTLSRRSGIPRGEISVIANIVISSGEPTTIKNMKEVYKTAMEDYETKKKQGASTAKRKSQPSRGGGNQEQSSYTKSRWSSRKVNPALTRADKPISEAVGATKDAAGKVGGYVTDALAATGKKSMGAKKSKYDKDK
jgi:hypothetical protein